MASLPGLQPPAEMVRGPLGMAATAGPFAVTPGRSALALVGGLGVASLPIVVTRLGSATRRAPTWGCGGLLTARTRIHGHGVLEAADDDLRAVYRPTREVEALAKVSPYFPQEVRYHVEIEPTFERYVYGPLTARAARGPPAEGPAGGQSSRISRLRDCPGLRSRAHGLVEKLNVLSATSAALLQAAGMLIVAPLLKSLIKKMKATFQNRQGPPLLQGYYDLAKVPERAGIPDGLGRPDGGRIPRGHRIPRRHRGTSPTM